MILDVRYGVWSTWVALKQKGVAMLFAMALPMFGVVASTPVIVSVEMCANDPTMRDVLSKVTSETNMVSVRALAFENGTRSFQYVVRPTVFVKEAVRNETTGNVGFNVTADADFDRVGMSVKVEEK